MKLRFVVLISLMAGLMTTGGALAQFPASHEKSAANVSREKPMANANPERSETSDAAVVSRVGDTAFVKVEADSFRALSASQQALAYWLTQAAIAI
ncbi:MAG: hypothetical protein JOY91_17265, partial [Sinobacteraceae bacterium]|nr:hypothetical protein [Nevskiaceae bacterium]